MPLLLVLKMALFELIAITESAENEYVYHINVLYAKVLQTEHHLGTAHQCRLCGVPTHPESAFCSTMEYILQLSRRPYS